jgi:hypothetical protein
MAVTQEYVNEVYPLLMVRAGKRRIKNSPKFKKGAGYWFIWLLQQGCCSRAYMDVFTRPDKSMTCTLISTC